MFLKRKSGVGLGRVAIGAKPCPGVDVRFEMCAGGLCSCRERNPYR